MVNPLKTLVFLKLQLAVKKQFLNIGDLPSPFRPCFNSFMLCHIHCEQAPPPPIDFILCEKPLL